MFTCKICGNIASTACLTANREDKIWHRYYSLNDAEYLDLKRYNVQNYCNILVVNNIMSNESSIQIYNPEYLGQVVIDCLVDIKLDFDYYLKIFDNLKYLG